MSLELERVMPPRNLTIIFFAAILSLVCYHKAERNRYATGVAEAMELVSEYYVEDVDSHAIRERDDRNGLGLGSVLRVYRPGFFGADEREP